MLLANTVYCVKLSGEDLSRYANKIVNRLVEENVCINATLLRSDK